MKYPFPDLSLNQIIKKYEIIDNNIIISYLDGHTKIIDYNKINELELLKEMLNQAKLRNNNSNYYNLVRSSRAKKDISYITYLIQFCVIFNLFFETNLTTHDLLRKCIILLLTIIYNLNYYNNKDKELNDFQKYQLYLEISDNLKQINIDISSFNELNKNEFLNINTLDNFSYEDLKKIYIKIKN